MKESVFVSKVQEAKALAKEKVLSLKGPKVFPSMAQFMSVEERALVASAQSRAMTKWWQSLNAQQRVEIGRRISEGQARSKTEKA